MQTCHQIFSSCFFLTFQLKYYLFKRIKLSNKDYYLFIYTFIGNASFIYKWFPSVATVPWKSILLARIRSRTLTGVGVNSTARLISSTQQWEYLSTQYFVHFQVGKNIHCELVNVSTQKFVKILVGNFNHHLCNIFTDILDFIKAFNVFLTTMFT